MPKMMIQRQNVYNFIQCFIDILFVIFFLIIHSIIYVPNFILSVTFLNTFKSILVTQVLKMDKQLSFY